MRIYVGLLDGKLLGAAETAEAVARRFVGRRTWDAQIIPVEVEAAP